MEKPTTDNLKALGYKLLHGVARRLLRAPPQWLAHSGQLSQEPEEGLGPGPRVRRQGDCSDQGEAP